MLFALILLAPRAVASGQSETAALAPLLPGPAQAAATRAIRIYSTTLRIPTYQYQDALVPTDSGDSIFPYPRLNFDLVGLPVMTSYRAIVLENSYLSVTILPALGGRVYRIRDRITGRDITYNNPVIKPTRWGIRGWWLATGGIEWAFPTEEHGLNEWRPWQYYTRQSASEASVTVHDQEDKTGMTVWVRVSLDAVHAYLTIQPGAYNPGPATQSFQFWLNGMLSLNNNHVSDNTRIVLPTSTVRLHSTNDPGLPQPGTDLSWPVYNNRDLSRLGNWNGYLGFFAYPSAPIGFAGAYDEDTDRGVVRLFPYDVAPGVKFFAPNGLDPNLWTDDGSSYFEMWGGVTKSFWDSTTLAPGQVLEWRERWYPVSGLGAAFNYADDTAAVRLAELGDEVQVGIAPTRVIVGRAILWMNGTAVAEWPLVTRPGRPFLMGWTKTESASGPIGLTLVDTRSQLIAKYGEGIP